MKQLNAQKRQEAGQQMKATIEIEESQRRKVTLTLDECSAVEVVEVVRAMFPTMFNVATEHPPSPPAGERRKHT